VPDSAPRPKLRPIASDRYTEFELVGKGGMGVVYLALDTELSRRVAFKMVLPDPGADQSTPAPATPLAATPPKTQSGTGRSFDELRMRFLQEAWVTGAMEHPGIVPVYELGETDEGIPYYTMRYVKGERTLKVAIEAARNFDERLALLEPFLKICDTIRYAHAQGVVHRDIKPENVALGSFGEVIVLDWGLAKMEGQPDISGGDWQARIEEYRDASDLRTVAGALGTPGFMAPEAALGRSDEVDARSDVYSLGAMLHVMLTGKLPFAFKSFLEYVNLVIREEPERADAVDEAVPSELADACARAMHTERAERFGSVDELATAIRRWQTEGPIEREIRTLLTRAQDELESGKSLTGNLLLLHLDRATTAVNRILHLRPEHEEAQHLQSRLKLLRERGISARVRSERLVVLQRVAAALLTLGAIVALVVFAMLSEEQNRFDDLRRQSGDRLAEADTMANRSRREAAITRERLARSLASMSGERLGEGGACGARVLAASALVEAQTPMSWAALAAAERAWAPTLHWVLHGANLTHLAFDPDQAGLIFAGDDEGGVYRIDLAATEGRLRYYDAIDSPVRCLAVYSENGERRLAVGGANGRAALLRTGERTFRVRMPAQLPPRPDTVLFADDTLYRDTAVTSIAPGAVSDTVVAGYADGRLRVFDGEGQLLHVARHHKNAVTSLRASPEPGDFFSASRDGSVNLWDPEYLLLRDTWTTDPNRPIAGIRIKDGGRRVEAWSTDGSVWSWALDAHAEQRTIDPMRQVASRAVLAPNGRLLVVASDATGVLRYHDANDGTLLHAGARDDLKLTALAVSPDGALVAAARSDGSLRIWDLNQGQQEAHRITAIAADAERVFHVTPDNRIEIRTRGVEGKQLLPAGQTARITAIAPTPDGTRLLAASIDGQVVVWDVERGEIIRTVRGLGGVLTAVEWAEGEDRFIAGAIDGRLRGWTWSIDKSFSFEMATEDPIALIARARHADRVVAADTAGGIYRWDSRTLRRVGAWSQPSRIVALAISIAGNRMAAVRSDGVLITAEGSDKAHWSEIGELPRGTTVLHLAVSNDGAVTWVDSEGRRGAQLALAGGAGLPVVEGGTSWILIDPQERLERFRLTFGLTLDRATYRIKRIDPKRMPGAIGLLR